LEKCGATGKSSEIRKNCESSIFHLSNDYIDEEKNLCEASFKVTCMDENEKLQCTNGQESAKLSGNCDDNESDAFKVKKIYQIHSNMILKFHNYCLRSQKCCNACKIGLSFKNARSACSFDLKLFGYESKAIATKCCVSESYYYYNDLEIPKTENQETDEIIIDYNPAPLTAIKNTNFSCKDYNYCDENEECVDTKCQCRAGFMLDQNSVCIDIDECQLGQHNCSKIHKECVNFKGYFRCSKNCAPGYEKVLAFDYYDDNEDLNCIDVDECVRNSNICSSNQQCVNTDGGFKCIKGCEKGFRNINDECIDFNECQDKTLCQWKCENLQGSYKCECPLGYYLDGSGKCRDIDECRKKVCGENNECTNVNGGYRCQEIVCPTEFVRVENSK
jgi:Calcium-binding EGF domain